jgi:2-C-methyl-D-erythritol 4-phosphate cytidylyltransferase
LKAILTEKFGQKLQKVIEAVIVAGGSGKRMGDVYKQFSLIAGKELFLYPLEKFLEYGVGRVILVVPEKKISNTKEKVSRFDQKIKVVSGGVRRQDSVYNGFKEASGEIILVHDAVRPFISARLIDRVVKGVEKFGICAPGIPVRDTLKIYKKDKILWTRSRTNLLQVQTPQGFRRDVLEHIVSLFSMHSFTDELAFAEKLNYDVHWVEGDPSNIKITYPPDMNLAQAIAGYKERNNS